jgi:vacuolar-type H+-ATPase subunit H
MSYADMAAKGPKQTPEEKMAPPVPSLEHEDSTSSLIDVDSPHISSVKSEFEDQVVKTETQATRLEHEAEDKARAAGKKVSEYADKAKKEARADTKKVKAEVKKDAKKLSDNRDNPVVIGNTLLWGITAVVLGVCIRFLHDKMILICMIQVGAYKKHQEGKLDWKLAGSVAGVVGVLGVADYFGSQWLLENKYPPK